MEITIEKIIFLIIIVLILYVIFAYNGFVKRKYRVKEAWSDIEVQLKRRYDLIGNLVNTVKGYAIHEKEVLTKITELRSNFYNLNDVKDIDLNQRQMNDLIRNLFVIVENYPQLKANENFKELQMELSDTENKIQAARRFYNQVVMDYNTFLKIFPNNLLNLIFRFKEEEFFDLESQEESKRVEVKF
jgi:LemA protein